MVRMIGEQPCEIQNRELYRHGDELAIESAHERAVGVLFTGEEHVEAADAPPIVQCDFTQWGRDGRLHCTNVVHYVETGYDDFTHCVLVKLSKRTAEKHADPKLHERWGNSRIGRASND